ncbi:MAG: long-chain-fatty-acid--CoA ligase [Elusimicrobia bacterium]|nr:long-chain-fatty-acid--CoA ligase [Elusimicrobiota bacterium]
MPEQAILTLNDLLDAAAERQPPAGGLSTPDERLSYRDLRSRVLRTAAGMQAAGVAKGDRVALVLRNGIPFVVSYFALARLGAAAVPINFMVQKPEDLGFMLKDCGAKAAVTAAEFLPGLRLAQKQAGALKAIWVVDESGPDERPFSELLRGDPESLPRAAASESDLAGILYTAGTTGVPKGVMLTHRNLVTNCTAAAAHMGLRRNDVMLCILPMFHSFAWTANVLVPMWGGVEVAIAPGVTPAKLWLKLMARHGVTVFTAIPQLYAVLAKEAAGLKRIMLRWWFFRRVRMAVSGAAPLAQETARRFEAQLKVPILEGYGLTETSPIATINPPAGRRPGTVGLPIAGVRLKIVDPEGRALPPGADGEVCIQGDCVMKGYYNHPQATAETISAEGWLKTGDVGSLDSDGYLTIKDRLKDMIIVKGLKVFSAQVEAALLEHPAVAEAAVVGVPDEVGNETVKAFVVLRRGAQADRAELLRFCRQRLDNYKRPRDVAIVAGLPKNALQKVLKTVLRRQELARRRAP